MHSAADPLKAHAHVKHHTSPPPSCSPARGHGVCVRSRAGARWGGCQAEGPAQPKVRQLGDAHVGQQAVGGLDVAMHDACGDWGRETPDLGFTAPCHDLQPSSTATLRAAQSVLLHTHHMIRHQDALSCSALPQAHSSQAEQLRGAGTRSAFSQQGSLTCSMTSHQAPQQLLKQALHVALMQAAVLLPQQGGQVSCAALLDEHHRAALYAAAASESGCLKDAFRMEANSVACAWPEVLTSTH